MQMPKKIRVFCLYWALSIYSECGIVNIIPFWIHHNQQLLTSVDFCLKPPLKGSSRERKWCSDFFFKEKVLEIIIFPFCNGSSETQFQIWWWMTACSVFPKTLSFSSFSCHHCPFPLCFLSPSGCHDLGRLGGKKQLFGVGPSSSSL